MHLTEYLEAHSASVDEVISAVQERLGVLEGEALCATGSLVEGNGNRRSNLNLYLITQRDLSSQRTGPAIIIGCGSAIVDLEPVSEADVRALWDRLQGINLGDPREAISFPQEGLILLHRLAIAQPLVNPEALSGLQEKIDRAALARVLIAEAVAEAPPRQIDLMGYLEEADYLSAILSGQALLAFVAQALLAALGDTNPSPKWRFRKLHSLSFSEILKTLPGEPLYGRVPEAFARLHLVRSAEPAAVVDFAYGVVNLANRVLPWAQALADGIVLLSPDEGTGENPHEDNLTILPALPIDIVARRVEGGVSVSRLHHGTELILNGLAWDALVSFDGRSSSRATSRRIARRSGASEREVEESLLHIQQALTEFGLLS